MVIKRLPPGPRRRDLFYDRIQFVHEHWVLALYGDGALGLRTIRVLTNDGRYS